MLTSAQLDAGRDRLNAGQLTLLDVDQLVSIFRMFFGDLEEKYGYEYEEKLTELNDTGNSREPCAQIAACLIELEDLGFGVTSLKGGRKAIHFSEKEEYWQYVCIAFTKIYMLPAEMSSYDLMRARFAQTTRTSGSACVDRVWN